MSKLLNKLRSLAMSNGRQYHVAAILRRKGIPIKVGTNSSKTHPFCRREYEDGTTAYQMHAETNVLRFAQPGDELEVIRFTKTGVSMAKPCVHCQRKIKEMKIKKVLYTNRNGEWEELQL
tara:strand:- start:128 stop:487 length:360 start_codon:yes stop_codon:yes gene_type:complete